MPRALRPFRAPAYRWLALALTLTTFGSGVWTIAAVLAVRQLGGGPGEFSAVAAGYAVGMLVAVLFGGAIADRVSKKLILISVAGIKAVAIAGIVALGAGGGYEVWHLTIAAIVLGGGDGFAFPAYSALLPTILPADDLLAANGFEGLLRPAVLQAAGPATAAAIVAALSPTAAFAVVAVAHAVAGLVTVMVRTPATDRTAEESDQHPVARLFRDIGSGFRYMFTTRWLVATLLLICILLFVFMGPFEVLLPFAIFEQTSPVVPAWGVAGNLAIALAAFGFGGAVGSAIAASVPLPRRYLTTTALLWGLGCLPLVVIGFTTELWIIATALFVVGAAFSAGAVLWGTLLQRRVAPEYYGRISSLDWFVSLLFMPVSMAVAGIVGELIGFAPAFLVAGVVPIVTAILILSIGRLGRDEIENPLVSPHSE